MAYKYNFDSYVIYAILACNSVGTFAVMFFMYFFFPHALTPALKIIFVGNLVMVPVFHEINTWAAQKEISLYEKRKRNAIRCVFYVGYLLVIVCLALYFK